MGTTKSYGVNQNGGFASHLTVPDAKYLVDPGAVSLPLAATYTCSGLTAFSAVRKASLAMQVRVRWGRVCQGPRLDA